MSTIKERVQELRSMLDQIPACNIVPQLRRWIEPDKDMAGTCGTLACLAGWAAHHEPFKQEGFGADMTDGRGHGHPAFGENSGFAACVAFFDSPEPFRSRGGSTYDPAIFEEYGRDITDHELCVRRVEKYLEELG